MNKEVPTLLPNHLPHQPRIINVMALSLGRSRYLESQVLFTATVVGLGPEGIEVDREWLGGQRLEEVVLLHQLGPQLVELAAAVVVHLVHSPVQLVGRGSNPVKIQSYTVFYCSILILG